MIISIKHKGLLLLWTENNKKFLPNNMVLKISQILYVLDTLEEFPADLNIYPNWKLHELKGNKKGTWSVWVKENWRITFKSKGKEFYDINFEDYH